METIQYPNQPQGDSTHEYKEYQDEMNFLHTVGVKSFLLAVVGEVITMTDYRETVMPAIERQKETLNNLYGEPEKGESK